MARRLLQCFIDSFPIYVASRSGQPPVCTRHSHSTKHTCVQSLQSLPNSCQSGLIRAVRGLLCKQLCRSGANALDCRLSGTEQSSAKMSQCLNEVLRMASLRNQGREQAAMRLESLPCVRRRRRACVLICVVDKAVECTDQYV